MIDAGSIASLAGSLKAMGDSFDDPIDTSLGDGMTTITSAKAEIHIIPWRGCPPTRA